MSNYLADQYLLEAEKLMDNEEYVEAKKKLDELLKIEPGYGRAHFLMGLYFWKNFSKYDFAGYHFLLAIKFSPEYPRTYYQYAYMLNEINNAMALKRHAIKALQVQGVNKAIIHNELGESFEKNTNFNKALHHYRIALLITVCSSFTKTVENNIERTESKLKMSSFKNSFRNEVLC